jgi:hypothetical protein
MALDAAGEPGRGLIDSMPFTWRGPRSGRIDPDGHENVEPSKAAKLDARMRLRPCQSRRGYLEPDATLIGGSGEDRRAVLIEYDRTERPHKQIDRLRRYDWWLLDGWRHTHFAAHSMPPTVIFLTSRERPLRRLIRTADQVLSTWYAQHYHGPREGSHPAREQILFTSRERILKGDWTMQRTPGLPPELRKDPRQFWSGSVVCDLPSLFGEEPIARLVERGRSNDLQLPTKTHTAHELAALTGHNVNRPDYGSACKAACFSRDGYSSGSGFRSWVPHVGTTRTPELTAMAV